MTEGESRKTTVALTAFLAVVLLGIGALGSDYVLDLAKIAEAKFFGVDAVATVTDKTWIPSEGRRVEYVLQLQDGQSYRRRVPVREGVFDSVEAGSRVAIRYAADDPSESVLIEGDLRFFGTAFQLLLIVVTTLLVGYALTRGLRTIRRTHNNTL